MEQSPHVQGSWSWQHLILQRAPVDKILPLIMTNIPSWPSYDSQAILVEFLLISSDRDSLPPSRWWKYFLKCLHVDIEKKNEEIHDSLMEMIVKASQDITDDDAGTVIFSLPNQTRALIHAKKIHNQVGMRLWTAGIYLSNLMMKLPLCEGRNVLELGAGTGCTGILLALSTNLTKIIMTDFHPDVMDNLQYNIELNSTPTTAMSCETLDWAYFTDGDVDHLLSELPNPVILAADCIYSIDLGILLVTILCKILSKSLPKATSEMESPIVNKPDQLQQYLHSLYSSVSLSSFFPYALIVQTIRQEDTFASFMKYLEVTLHDDSTYQGLLNYHDITEWIQNYQQTNQRDDYFYYDKNENIRVICIFPIGKVTP